MNSREVFQKIFFILLLNLVKIRPMFEKKFFASADDVWITKMLRKFSYSFGSLDFISFQNYNGFVYSLPKK